MPGRTLPSDSRPTARLTAQARGRLATRPTPQARGRLAPPHAGRFIGGLGRFPRLLPLSALLALLCLLPSPGVSFAAGGADRPREPFAYCANPGNPLARSSWGDLCERDLYLFLLMRGEKNPDLYKPYVSEKDEKKRAALRSRLVEAVQDWAFTLALASQVPDTEPVTPLDQIRLRLLLHPVHRMIWTDRQVAPRVLVALEDVLKYYNDHSSDFPSSPTARVRYIFLPVSADPAGTISLEQRWRDARSQMDRIHNQVLTQEISFEQAARKYSKASNAGDGGLTPEFLKGTFFPKFEEQAFGLPDGNFSKVFDGPDGVYLLQGQVTAPPGVLPFRAVMDRIHELAFAGQLALVLKEEVQNLRTSRFSINRSRLVRLLNPWAPVLKVRGFRLDTDTVWDLFPDLIRPTFDTDETALVRTLLETETNELIAQDNERRGWDADVRLLPAVKLAKAMWKSDKRAGQLIHPYLILTRAQVREYVQAYPGILVKEIEPAGYLIRVQSPEPGEMGEANWKRKMDQIRGAMLNLRDQYSSTTLTDLAQSWPVTQADPVTLIPKLLEEELIRGVADGSVTVETWNTSQPVSDLPGEVRPAMENVKKSLSGWIAAGVRFPPLVEGKNSLGMLYVEKPDYGSPAQANLNQSFLYQTVAREIGKKARKALRETLVGPRDLQILFQ
jgi:parvulin-like peptidyl-prolyl isomerase